MASLPTPDGTSPARPLTVVQVLPALESGGAERSALEIARALVAVGHRSVVVSAGGRLVSRLEAEGSRHIALAIGRKSLTTLLKIRELRRVLADIRPDIVHARSRLPAWIALAALRKLRPRAHFVTTVHGLNSPGKYSSVMLRGERVIIVSHSVRDYVLRHYPWVQQERLRVIPRGIDPSEFPYGYRPDDAWQQRFTAEFPALQEAPLLTLPGRGTRLKGHADGIHLMADLKARGIDARLLMLGIVEVGREAYLDEMRALAHALGVTDRVVFSPPRADIRDVLASSALVLQLSNYPESFGRTVIEALALCRPVLGYAHGGVGDLLAELYPAGRVAPGNRERLAERAAELLRLAPPIPPLQHYTLEAMQRATLAVYAEFAEPSE
ncbi:MAG TPA: glycosyltransferase [Rhodanobacteraceae bacterium]|nr:glycosyltransferase [Rhodanobacteraceae bacterium]